MKRKPVTLRLSYQKSLFEDAFEARNIAFPGPISERDVYDTCSVHIELRADQRLAAYGRLTAGPPGVFNDCSVDGMILPIGPDVADLGRCFVCPEFRQLGLLGLVCVLSFMVAAEMNCTQVNGACIPGRRIMKMLTSIGYQPHGEPGFIEESNGNRVLIQPLTISLHDKRTLRSNLRKRLAKCSQHDLEIALPTGFIPALQ